MLDLPVRVPRNQVPTIKRGATSWHDLSEREHHANEIPLLPAWTADRNGTPYLPASSTQSSEPELERDTKRWIALIQRSDESGLRQLHRVLRPEMFRCALAIVRREEMADEIVSTSLMQVWTSASSYDAGRGSAIGWLMVVVRSRSFDALRCAKLIWRREVRLDEDDALNEYSAARDVEPLSKLEGDRRDTRVRRALLRLSPMQRQVLSLTSLEGLSQDEASHHLDLPLGTIKSHARRGLAALRTRCDEIGLSSA